MTHPLVTLTPQQSARLVWMEQEQNWRDVLFELLAFIDGLLAGRPVYSQGDATAAYSYSLFKVGCV